MLEWLFGKKKEPQPKKQQKKPKKSQKQQQQEDKWMYDFLVQFLSSPVWRVSILDFVDNKCLVFDNEQENKFQYTKIHNEFKQLVANLFDGWISEVGVPQQKLAELLQRGFQSRQKKLFNQLLLCDDFLKFKQLMLKRNKALEEQALRAMKGEPIKQTQLLKTQKQQEARKNKLNQEEQEVLKRVLQISRKQAEQQQAIAKLQEAAFVHQLKNSQKELAEEKPFQNSKPLNQEINKGSNDQQEQKPVKDDRKQRIKAKLRKQKLNPLPIQQSNQNAKSSLPPLKNHLMENQKKNQPQWNYSEQKKQEIQHKVQKIQLNQAPLQNIQKIQQPVKEQKQQHKQQAESQQQRKKRLLEQRQKIRKKKQEQRKKMLLQSQAHNPNNFNVVLQDDGIHQSHIGGKRYVQDQQTQQTKVSKQQVQRRKALMKKIKNRIVDDF